jgi:hypothetical protein
MTLVIKANHAIKNLDRCKKNNESNESNMLTYAKKYKNSGYVPFTLNLKTDARGKKRPFDVPPFSTIDSVNCLNYVNNEHNCMALRMGLKCDNNNNYVVLIDIDTSEDNATFSGMKKWKELLDEKDEINTPTQKTGNNGLHYLFKVTENVYNTLPAAITKIVIDGKKYSIDFKGKNQLVFVAPTKYDGKIYKWTTEFTDEIQTMPKWLLSIITGSCDRKIVKLKKIIPINTKSKIKNHQNRSSNKNTTDSERSDDSSEQDITDSNKKKNHFYKNMFKSDQNKNHTTNENTTKSKSKSTKKSETETKPTTKTATLKAATTKTKQTKQIIHVQNNKKSHSEIKKTKKENKIIDENSVDVDKESEPVQDIALDFTDDEISDLLELLSNNRRDSYDDWLKIGICLYNINNSYLLIWKNWSKKNNKYTKGICESKWKTFKNIQGDKNKLSIGSLIYWCKIDNEEGYKSFFKEKNTKKIINKKFPDVDLDFGETQIVTKDTSYTTLNNDNCFIYGDTHGTPTMYVEKTHDRIIIKCKHPTCFGKTYPCEHILLSKTEMNIMNNGIMNLTINNYGLGESNEIMKFPRFNMFEDEVINELIFNSLNGGHATLADIIYYYFKDDYIYAEDKNWYVFANHKWNFLGFENENLSLVAEKKLKSIYMDLIKFAEDVDVNEK